MSHRFVDISGQKFNKITAIKPMLFIRSKSGSMVWECVCDCGKVLYLPKYSLNRQKSCGCILKGMVRHSKHNHAKHGQVTPEYNSWATMKQRCENQNNHKFYRYGGRGIAVCDRWSNSFENFLADMGRKPKGFSLERIDVNGPYSPENCKWASAKEQANNKVSHRMLTHNGMTMNTSQWAEYLGMKFATLRMRLHRGWPIERALS